jgi:hypothetical protein
VAVGNAPLVVLGNKSIEALERLMIILPFFAIALWATLAPRIEVYTILTCKALKPEYPHLMDPQYLVIGHHSGVPSGYGSFPLIDSLYLGNESSSKRCADDPVVQAEAAKLAAGMRYRLYTDHLGFDSD